MTEDVSGLFDEYALRRARGERPDVREYLDRAGERAGELRPLLDRLLASTPPAGNPDPALVAAFEALTQGEPPLLALRTTRGVRRDAVVTVLVERLGIDALKREKVKRYYHELESGLLDTGRVAQRVFEALEEILGADVDGLARWRPFPPAAAAPTYYRAGTEAPLPRVEAAVPAPGEEEWDEVDELFLGAARSG